MGLAWQQGPMATESVGRFLTPEPLPARLLFAEPLRRRTNAWPEVGRVRNLVSFEPDKIDVYLDGRPLKLEPGQHVVPHGVDRGLDPDEILHETPSRRIP
jgi:hypothetical protein